eukprot:c33300_g1_i1 orf=133-1344(+)
MHTLGFSCLLLSLALLSSFHGKLATGQQTFIYPSGGMQWADITPNNATVVNGILSLDASTEDSEAFHSKAISSPLNSFSSVFTFSSNLAGGNGTIAFVLTPDISATVSLEAARKTFTVEFNTSCSDNGNDFYGGNWGRGGGGFGGFGGGGFQILEYANGASVGSQNVSTYPNQQYPAGGPFFCAQQGTDPFDDPTNPPQFQYQVVLYYNATTDILWVGSPNCGGVARIIQFAPQELSSIITKSVYAGFIASEGGVYNISQWNFTSNAATNSSISNLIALSTGTSSTTTGSDSGSRGGRSHGGLSKGYVIGFSILGAAIGIATAFLVCCLCARCRKRETSIKVVGAKSVHAGIIPESKVVFDARKPNAPPVMRERDTIPLNPNPNSAFHASTGGATWLHPVAPR